jgi:hypothetical protein
MALLAPHILWIVLGVPGGEAAEGAAAAVSSASEYPVALSAVRLL